MSEPQNTTPSTKIAPAVPYQRHGLDMPADGVMRTVDLAGDAGMGEPEVREMLERPHRLRPHPELGRPVIYRVPVSAGKPPLAEPGWIVKVHPPTDPKDDRLLVDLQVLWSHSHNGARLIANVEYDPDEEREHTWSLPY